MNGNVTVKSKRSEVQREFLKKAQRALEKIGMKAESAAKQLCPVDTGTLRNSISHEGHELTEYIGTNEEYGKNVEFDDNAKHKVGQAHFLRDSIMGQFNEYRLIVEKELKD